MADPSAPLLTVVVPCYNEQEALPLMAPVFSRTVRGLVEEGLVSPASCVLYVDDGSEDGTWGLLVDLAACDSSVRAIRQSRNRGHQNAVLAGLMEARTFSDVVVSIDCDGQDDVSAMGEMVRAYRRGFDVVYGVRSARPADTRFKRGTARMFNRLLAWLGADIVDNHADYRLVSRRVLDALADYREVNLFLRGLVPLVGFASTEVAYERLPRVAGRTHYSLGRMVALALDGITSLSVRPLRLIIALGLVVSIVSFVGVAWAVVTALLGYAVSGWASNTSIICFIGGIQLLCLGVIGEYVGKIYLEVKARPRFVISDRAGFGDRRDAAGCAEGAVDPRSRHRDANAPDADRCDVDDPSRESHEQLFDER